MNKVFFLLLAMALPAWAAPQTSDEALRAAQVPSLPGTTFSGVDDFKGVSIKPGAAYILSGTPSGVGFVDLSRVTEVDGGGNLTVTPAMGVASNIGRVVGDSITSQSDGISTIYASGSAALLTFSGFSTDPGFHAFSINGGDGEAAFWLSAGDASVIMNGNTWTSLTLSLSLSMGSAANPANAGTPIFSAEVCTAMTTLTITSWSMFVGNCSGTEYVDFFSCTSLANLNVPASIAISFDGTYFGGSGAEIRFSDCALTAASAQALLDALVAGSATSTNSFPMAVDISGGTSAPPTDGGTDAGILASYGYNIYTN